MLENASRFSASADKAVIMGGSSGANLSCAVTLSMVGKEPGLKPRGLVVACSSTIHPSIIPEEYKDFWHPEQLADSAMLDRKSMMTCMGTYRDLRASL
jgi:acetyl esterase/lipase